MYKNLIIHVDCHYLDKTISSRLGTTYKSWALTVSLQEHVRNEGILIEAMVATIVVIMMRSLDWSREQNVRIVQKPSRHFYLNLAKIPPNQVIADFGRGSSVESESE